MERQLRPNDLHLAKIPLTRRITPSRPILVSPCRNFFQPTHNKEEIDTVGGAGSESRSPQRFLLRVSEFSILKKLQGNAQLHAGTNSEVGPVECGSLLDFDFTFGIPPVLHHHSSKSGPDQYAHRCCLNHQAADLFEAGNSDDAVP